MVGKMSIRAFLTVTLLFIATPLLHAQVLDTPDSGDSFGASIARGDFNGDGFADLAIGVPAESFNGVAGVGAVNILYAGVEGLTDIKNDFWHQDKGNLIAEGEAGDAYGKVLSTGDYNGDGYEDLAIAAVGKAVNGQPGAGSVFVLYGAADGLTDANQQTWHQDVAGIEGESEAGDAFGHALASGDFNTDGYDELVIGIPGKNVSGELDAGRILVLPGSANGLTMDGYLGLDQGTEDVSGTEEAGDLFGRSLATGDFNGDGFGDLAIGIPGEDRGDLTDSGATHILYGAFNGLRAAGNQIFDQDIDGVAGDSEAGDRLGAALAAGDFNKDGISDLAVGAPGEDVEGQVDAGSLLILYGTTDRIRGAGSQDLHQNVAGMLDAVEAGDLFADALSAGDFNGDGFGDLAIGVPKEDLDGIADAGVVVMLMGSDAGITTEGNQFWRLDSALAPLTPGDGFGQALSSGDWNKDGFDDLSVGIPFKDMPGVTDVGAVGILFGTHSGLTSSGAQLWDQSSNPRAVDVEADKPGIPVDFQLLQNYPNPFNPTTTISYRLDAPATVKLEVFDALGKPVFVLVNNAQGRGTHQVNWQGTDSNGNAVGSGVYLYRLEVDGKRQARQMLLLK